MIFLFWNNLRLTEKLDHSCTTVLHLPLDASHLKLPWYISQLDFLKKRTVFFSELSTVSEYSLNGIMARVCFKVLWHRGGGHRDTAGLATCWSVVEPGWGYSSLHLLLFICLEMFHVRSLKEVQWEVVRIVLDLRIWRNLKSHLFLTLHFWRWRTAFRWLDLGQLVVGWASSRPHLWTPCLCPAGWTGSPLRSPARAVFKTRKQWEGWITFL